MPRVAVNRERILILAAVLTFGLVGCGGNGSVIDPGVPIPAGGGTGGTGGGSGTPGPAAAPGTLSGQATKGPLLPGSIVRAYRIAAGARGALLGQTTDVRSGAFTIEVTDSKYSGLALLEAEGTFTDEATGSLVATGQSALRGIAFGLTPGGSLRDIQVTPVTDIAVALAQGRGGLTEGLLRQAMADAGARFGVPSPESTVPSPLDATARTAQLPNLRYALVLASLSGEAANKGVALATLLAGSASDAGDGSLDGTRGGTPILLPGAGGGSVLYSPESLTSELAAGLDRFLNSIFNLTGIGPSTPVANGLKSTYLSANRSPTARLSVFPLVTTTGLPIQLDGRNSSDPEGARLSYLWKVTIDGRPIAVAGEIGSTALVIPAEAGNYAVRLTVTDSVRQASTASSVFTVEARPPDPTPARVQVGTLLSPSTVTAGSSFVADVELNNAGQIDALELATSLREASTFVTATARASNPSTLRGGETAIYRFDVQASGRTPAGAFVATLDVTFRDARSNRITTRSFPIAFPTRFTDPPTGLPLILAQRAFPLSLGQGQARTLTIDLTNPPGGVTATIGEPSLIFAGSGIVPTLLLDGVGQLAPGASGSIAFLVTADFTAAPGSQSFSIQVPAVSTDSGRPLASHLATGGTLTVVGQARYSVRSLTVSPAVVSFGTPIDITGSIVSDGAVPANFSSLRLAIGSQNFLPATLTIAGLAQPVTTTVPVIPMSQTVVASFTARIDSRLLPIDTALTAGVVVAAADSFTGRPVPIVQPAVPPIVLVQGPTSLAIRALTPTPAVVSQGQIVRVQMIVSNAGSADSLSTLASLSFSQGATDLTTRFFVAAVGTPPAVVPGKTTLSYDFDVTVPVSGVLGAVAVTGNISGRDANSGALLTPTPATLAWTVQATPNLTVGPLSLPPKISQGQTATGRISLTNNGQATAQVVSTSLAFTPPGGLTVGSLSNITSIPGGATMTLVFDVISSPATAPGTRTADLLITVRDVNSGAIFTFTTPNAGTLTVESAAAISVVQVAGDRPANIGQLANPGTIRLRNSGQATGVVQSLGLSPALPGFNPRLNQTLPIVLPGGTDLFVPFLFDVPATVSPGLVDIGATLTAADQNSGIASIVTGTTVGGLVVQRRFVLAFTDVSISAPSAIDRGGLAATVTLRVQNASSSSASFRLDTAPLVLTRGGATVTATEYVVTPPADLLTRDIPGGTTQNFDFTVRALPVAVKFSAITLSILARGHDLNDGAISSQSAATQWFVRDAADSVFGQPDLVSGLANRGGGAGSNTLNLPQCVATDGARLAVSDLANNRVLLFRTLTDQNAAIAVGQPNLVASTPGTTANSLRLPQGAAFAGGRLIVADRGNNRVLVYNDVLALLTGTLAADLVLGQSTFSLGAANRSTQPATPPAANTLDGPSDVAVVGTNLFVADTNNHRVLLYRNFDSLGNGAGADLVLGQSGFSGDQPNQGLPTPGPDTMSSPVSVAITGSRLLVADSQNHRVLVWNDITTLFNGRGADLVLGQANFTSGLANRGGVTVQNGFNSPSGLRTGGTGLFIADSLNHRVSIYSNFTIATPSGASPDDLLGQTLFTQSVANNGLTGTRDGFSLQFPAIGTVTAGALYVPDQLNNRVLRIPMP